MSPHARAIGAVNTLIPIRNSEDSDDTRLSQESSVFIQKSRAGPIKGLHGDNTDWIGICNCIRRGLSPANAVRPSTTGLVIGSGGMARAAVYSMIHLGVQNIFVYNRTLANAEKLAHHYNRQDLFANERMGADGRPRVSTLSSLDEPWPADYKQPTIIVSGIPAHSIGGAPAPNFHVPTQWLESPTGGVVVDVSATQLVSRDELRLTCIPACIQTSQYASHETDACPIPPRLGCSGRSRRSTRARVCPI
jgi:shikimate 5-dehydrogenase